MPCHNINHRRSRKRLPMPRATAKYNSSPVLAVLLFIVALLLQCAAAQSGAAVRREPNQSWDGRRIVTLKGFGDYFISADHGQAQLIRPKVWA